MLPEDAVLNLLLLLGFLEVSLFVALAAVIALNLFNFLVMVDVENCRAPVAVNGNLFGIRTEKNFKLRKSQHLQH